MSLLVCGAFAFSPLRAQGPSSAVEAKPATGVPIPLETFARLPFLEAPQLSPDGTRIAVKLAIDGEQRFAIVPLDRSARTAQLTIGDNELRSWRWVNDQWLIATISATRLVENDEWLLTRTLAISADGKHVTMLGQSAAGQNAADVLWIAQDGSPHVRIALQTSIYTNEPGFWPEVRDYDVSTGKSVLVQHSVDHVFDWYADSAGTVRYGIAYDDAARSYRLLYRGGPGEPFRTMMKAQGRNASLGTLPAVFLPEADRAIAFDDDDGFDALYRYDLTTLKTGERLFGVPGYDVDGVVTADGGSRIIGARYTDTRPRTHWFDPALADIQAKIDASVGTHSAEIVSWSRDFATLLVLVGGGDRAGSYYVFRPEEGVMHRLALVSEALGARGYAPVRTIRYKARDGLEIAAVLTVPPAKAAKALPLILMPHGGPAARDDEEWDWWAQFLASRGYAVLQPNYRGSTGFGNAFLKKGLGQWGLAMQDDLDDAVEWATGSGLADGKRVCIVRGSYGGYAALRAAQRGGVYRCAVSFAGVSDMPAMLRYDGQFLTGERNKDYLRTLAPDLRGVSPITGAGSFAMPVLVLHGKKDKVVPVVQSRTMAARLKDAGKVYRYVEQPLGDHHLSRQADREEFLRELERFLETNNPA